MMTSSIPSVEDFTNAFPNQLTPIVGEPTYTTLNTLKDQLKANTASIPTTHGSGNHGYLLMCGRTEIVLYWKHCVEYTTYNCFLYNIHSLITIYIF